MDIPSEDNIGPGQALKAGAGCEFFPKFSKIAFL